MFNFLIDYIKMDFVYSFIYSFVLLFNLVLRIYGEAYFSLVNVERLIWKDRKLVQMYEKFFERNENNKNKTISRYKELLLKLEKANSKAIGAPFYSQHPINCFHLFNRLVNQWSRLFRGTLCQNCIQSESTRELKKHVNGLKYDSVGWPTKYDVTGCAIALLRLWKVYDLKLEQLFIGKILDWKTDPLSPKDVILILKSAMKADMNYHGTKWAEALLKELDKTDVNKVKDKLINILVDLYKRNGMTRELQWLLEMGRVHHPERENETKNLSSNVPSTIFHPDRLHERYEHLCTDNLKTSKELTQLACVLRETKIPFHKSKEEILHLQPRVSLFYDVISDEEIRELKRMAITDNTFTTSKIHGKQNYMLLHSRVSMTAWIYNENSITKRLGKRLSLITGLDTEWKYPVTNAELMQVVNYGVGGMYTPHTDYLGSPYLTSHEDPLLGSGDRIATWMFYLNDVRAGGFTVFPLLNTRISPVKGSAAFWYNIKPDGKYDRYCPCRCPVLLGQKWIANKWIRELGQTFTRPCGLRRDATN